MTLREMQTEAWQIAEDKGHHDNLHDVMQLGTREEILADTIYIYRALSAFTQYVKRYGIDGGREQDDLNRLLDVVEKRVHDMRRDLKVVPRTRNDILNQPTFVRLSLIHTEVDEAAEAYASFTKSFDDFATELSDIVIRVGDLAEECCIDLDYWIPRKLEENVNRLHRYGTPQEGK